MLENGLSFNNKDGYIQTLKFLDSHGLVIKTYNPSKCELATNKRIQLEAEEELIGVYGVIGNVFKHFYSFGFLVREK